MRIKTKAAKKKEKAYGWAAMGTLASGVFGLRQSGQRAVGSVGTWKKGPAAQGSLPARRYDIPAGPLEAVIPTFQTATDLRFKQPMRPSLLFPRLAYRAATQWNRRCENCWPEAGSNISSPGRIKLRCV
jgi:hypothetical protein